MVAALVTTFCQGQSPAIQNYDHAMDLTTAASMVKSWKDNSCMSTQKLSVFGNDAIDAIQAQTGCVGVKFYNAFDANGVFHLVAVGVYSDNSDIIPGIIMERSRCCIPYYCNIGCPQSALNPN